jgi:hypothetical protein
MMNTEKNKRKFTEPDLIKKSSSLKVKPREFVERLYFPITSEKAFNDLCAYTAKS